MDTFEIYHHPNRAGKIVRLWPGAVLPLGSRSSGPQCLCSVCRGKYLESSWIGAITADQFWPIPGQALVSRSFVQ